MTYKLPQGISLARTYGDNVTEQTVISVAETMISRGLKDAGYEYLIIGDGCFAKKRDPETGSLVWDSVKFPRGGKFISDYLHSKGIKLGITVSAGALTANGAPGCLDHEYSDAEAFASWGVDYVAYDTVRIPFKADVSTLIRRMGMALHTADTNIVYAVYSDMPELYRRVRSAGADVYCTRCFNDAAGVMEPEAETFGYSGDYCRRSCGDIKINVAASCALIQTELIIAASFTSPIIVDCDPSALSVDMVALLTNQKLLSIANDPEGRSARKMSEGVYCKFLDNAEYAIAFINREVKIKTLSMYTFDFGLAWNSSLTCEATSVFDGSTVAFDSCIDVKLGADCSELYRMILK